MASKKLKRFHDSDEKRFDSKKLARMEEYKEGGEIAAVTFRLNDVAS